MKRLLIVPAILVGLLIVLLLGVRALDAYLVVIDLDA